MENVESIINLLNEHTQTINGSRIKTIEFIQGDDKTTLKNDNFAFILNLDWFQNKIFLFDIFLYKEKRCKKNYIQIKYIHKKE